MHGLLTRHGWVLLGVFCFVAWLTIVITLHVPAFILLIACGYSLGRARCNAEIERLTEREWCLRLRVEELTDITNQTVDRLHAAQSEQSVLNVDNAQFSIDTEKVSIETDNVNIKVDSPEAAVVKKEEP